MKVLKALRGYLSLQRPTTAQDKQCLQIIPPNPCKLIRASGLDRERKNNLPENRMLTPLFKSSFKELLLILDHRLLLIPICC